MSQPYLSTLTPAALAREAERQLAMARHAADCPAGYTRETWRNRCVARARELAALANRDAR